MATKDKNIWILLIFLLAGLVLGGLIGELTKNVDWLWWLSYGQTFGLADPVTLDLNVIKFSFSLMVKFNIASIIGIALGIWIYRKV